MRSVKHFIEQSWLLIAAAFCFGLLLAMTNAALKDKIEQNQIDALNNMMRGLMSEATNFEKVIDQAEIAGYKTDIYKASDNGGQIIGFAFVGTGAGFADKIKLIIAVDGTCDKFLGFDVLSSNETPLFGDRIKEDWFRAQFVGAPAGALELIKSGDTKKIDNKIVAITGATVSSQATVKIFNDHIEELKSILKEKGLID
ncbi:MAG: FMN-binding protein [Sedimentisphaerales bacterium]|nr:FMN-binding protein [Sedimentisphaerales bacterium]